jgi:hypothetical protein
MNNLKLFFYNSKQLQADMKLCSFLNQLNHALINDLPLNEFEIPVQNFKRYNHKEYLKQFDYNNLITVEELFKSVIDYLIKNKYKQSKERKIEIFNLIMYWFSLSNLNAWILYNQKRGAIYGVKTCKIITNNYSFEWLHEFQKG